MRHGTGNLATLRRPIVQGGGIEIRAIGPDQCVNLGIQHDLFKEVQVAQRPVELALEDGAEINFPAQAVVKTDLQGVWPEDGERLHLAKGVRHKCG